MLSARFGPLVRRVPAEVVRINNQTRPPVLCILQVLLHQLGSDTDEVLSLPVLYHVECLQRADDVVLRDARERTGREGESTGRLKEEGKEGVREERGRGDEGRKREVVLYSTNAHVHVYHAAFISTVYWFYTVVRRKYLFPQQQQTKRAIK